MELSAAAAALADDRLRETAIRTLLAAGTDVIYPLLLELIDPESWIDKSGGIDVLRRFGPAAWSAVVEQLATAESPEIVDVCCRILEVPAAPDIVQCALDVCAEDPDIRAGRSFVIGSRHRADCAPLLVPLLADPVPQVRAEAVTAFGRLGRSTVPLLRRVRRSRIPERHYALAALTQIGWDTPEPRDLAVLARWIRTRLASDVLDPVVPRGGWYAVETTDRAAVLETFALSDPVAVPWSVGTDVWRGRDARPGRAAYGAHAECARMYVTPVIDGWTLVFGTPVPDSEVDRHDHEIHGVADVDNGHGARHHELERRAHEQRRQLCAVASARFGRANWYGQDFDSGCDDWWGWCLAVAGKVERYYYDDHNGGSVRAGPAHPIETRAGLDVSGPPTGLGRTGALAVAGFSSVDPSRLGSMATVEGYGVVALTACGRRLGHRGIPTMPGTDSTTFGTTVVLDRVSEG